MGQTKATKKFEKNHLKDTIKRRNEFRKIKQKQILKSKKKARKAEDEKPADGVEDGAAKTNGRKESKNAFQEMSVDDFFQGGFEIPTEQKGKGKKRKRALPEEELGEDSDDSIQQEPVQADGASEDESEDDMAAHKLQLNALAEKDPEFHKYLQDNDAELLDFAGDDDLDGLELSASEAEDDEPKKKRAKTADAPGNELTKPTVEKWQKALAEQYSLRAAKEVVLAFRAAAHVSDEEGKDYKYSISDPDVYHSLLVVALKHIPEVLQHHVPVKERKGKVQVPTDSKKYKTLAPLLKSHTTSILHLLDHLSDASTLRLTLSSILPLLPYLLSFKKLVRDLAKTVVNIWSSSSNTEATRIAAFLILRRLVVIGDPGIRENVLKSTYQGLVRGSRNTTVHTIQGVNLMKNSAAELWGLDTQVGYTTGFTFIRQLAIHLRGSITNNSNESYKTVYNWQYVHSLDFWSRVLSVHCTSAQDPLGPLIYPLVQVTMGALRLIPTATYFPLRFQLIRSLLRIGLSTSTYIPLAPSLYEVLNSAEMRKAPKASTLKPLDFATSIRAPKSYLKTRVYQDGLGEQVAELLSEFLLLHAKSIAFPELALPVCVMLKRWLRDVNSRVQGQGNKNMNLNGRIKLLVEKLEANARFVEERRAKVEFAPNNRAGVQGFLKEVEWSKTPLGAFVLGQRKTREEKARLIEEARKDDERRRGREKRGAVGEVDGVESEEGSEDDDDGDLEMDGEESE